MDAKGSSASPGYSTWDGIRVVAIVVFSEWAVKQFMHLAATVFYRHRRPKGWKISSTIMPSNVKCTYYLIVRASTGRIIALAALGTRICFKPRHPQLHWVPKVHFRPQHTMICLISLKHWKPTVCTRSQRAPQGWLSCPWQFDLCYFHTMSHIFHGFPTNWSGQPSAEKGSFKKNIHPKKCGFTEWERSMWPTAKGTWNGAAAALAEQGENLLQKPWNIRRLQIMVRHLRAREHMETVETHKGEELYVAQYILVKSRLNMMWLQSHCVRLASLNFTSSDLIKRTQFVDPSHC